MPKLLSLTPSQVRRFKRISIHLTGRELARVFDVSEGSIIRLRAKYNLVTNQTKVPKLLTVLLSTASKDYATRTLKAKGYGNLAIARALGIHRDTVVSYLN